jgi:hypothetical protein
MVPDTQVSKKILVIFRAMRMQSFRIEKIFRDHARPTARGSPQESNI